jgi:PAS domain-containing protein
MAVALKERRPNRGTEAIAERPDGTPVPFLPYPTPLFDSTGALIGAVNTLVDITDRHAAESRIRESEARHRTLAAIVESSTDAILCEPGGVCGGEPLPTRGVSIGSLALHASN